MPKVSVIIPVYNVEKYLSRCIDSVLAQTFTDFEILLIDDGSYDNSGYICDQYAENDNRIRVFHKENGGVSSARNVGLDNARGEWIAFIDADDWISEDYLKQEYDVNTDIIQLGYNVISENGELIRTFKVQKKILTKQESIYKHFVQKRTNALWDKLFSYNVISKTRFNIKVSVGEDFLFTLSLMKTIKSYSFSTTGMYSYINRDDSTMGRINKRPRERLSIALQNIDNICKTINNLHYLKNSILFSTYLNIIILNASLLTKEEKEYIIKLFSKIKLNTLKYVTLKDKVYIYIKWLIFKLFSRTQDY